MPINSNTAFWNVSIKYMLLVFIWYVVLFLPEASFGIRVLSLPACVCVYVCVCLCVRQS